GSRRICRTRHRGFCGYEGHPWSRIAIRGLAEGVGFEPTDGCPSLGFKTSALNRWATLPFHGAGVLTALAGVTIMLATPRRRSANPLRPSQAGPQCLGNVDRAVRILVVLHDRDQGAADRDARTVQGMHEFGLAGLRIAPAREHAPRLEVRAVRARGDLAVGVLARQPD